MYSRRNSVINQIPSLSATVIRCIRQPVRTVARHRRRLVSFIGVGMVGVVTVNTGLAVLKELGHVGVYLAAAVAGQVAILTTFSLNSVLTWRDRQNRRMHHSLALYEFVNLAGLALYVGTIALLHGAGHIHYLIAGVCGSGVAALSNYCANHLVVFPFAEVDQDDRHVEAAGVPGQLPSAPDAAQRQHAMVAAPAE